MDKNYIIGEIKIQEKEKEKNSEKIMFFNSKMDKKRTWRFSITDKDKQNEKELSEKKKESKNEIIETNQIINIYTNKNTVADKKQKEKEEYMM